MTDAEIRKGMPPVKLSREEFERRYKRQFVDPAFAPLQRELDAVVGAAWDAYSHSRKAPLTRKAGAGFSDPDYDIAVDWLDARAKVLSAQRRHDDAQETPRILVINGSARSEHTCPGEMSKTWRLVELAEPVFVEMGFAVDILDLSRLASEFGKTIHPCKSCVSTAMPLCHWPCSCYPNYSLGQTGDWMNEIYPLWVAAHGILIVTPVNWYHVPSGLKAMMDRMVCADGGNPDPTSTHGKKADAAKAMELKGWPYPRHLAGRHFGVVVHGDAVGAEGVRRALSDWLTDMQLISAGRFAELDGYVGYMEPYAVSHRELDDDGEFQQEVQNAARALGNAVRLARSGCLQEPGTGLQDPNPK
ncbi:MULTISPECIES: flavodoxin family protein [Bradyrhizobium]|uniref:Multimeric flavodoxin WrbA n=1 Tax=Bradyrhizobium ottawaense TaxID=931866 RepID=A0ABV4G093_9BRAD|nr:MULTISPECIES: flavodoxin family protein [Bradyrhizobium]MBR1294358.1 flavodoxin family protein [Bradyrhizobium ottawaense]MDA9414491.1 NADPH-dependent FMN reductase [Bradyrhizobium sp. CCBAU 25360]MDA9481641.1 NADPH-dependent FMN reductase [Bradyrhizobium sp. CCBAU 11445]PDT64775.1 flavodoxin family protein [Bradyrhizobium ottawaense]WLB43205.1 flavodoxin family protein [Bradyrhizobium ottawaense]